VALLIHTLPVRNKKPIAVIHMLEVSDSIVRGIAVFCTNIGNINQDAIGNEKPMVGSLAGTGCGRSAYMGNGTIDRTQKSKGYNDLFGEKHDVEIELLEKNRNEELV
jgi:hypothetical protein